MRQYRRMTWDDRLRIEALYNAGHTYRFIAEQTGFTPAAIHYEVKRGLYTHLDWKTYDFVKRYSAQIAHESAVYNASSKGQQIKLGKRHDYAREVAQRIHKGESPDSIVGTNGHWELDSIIGKSKGTKQSLLTLTERKTRYEIVIRVKDKTSRETVKALDRIIPHFPHGTFKTITVDNGSEFQDCYGMEHDSKGNKRLDVYYCHPYTSSERGTNERNNRMLRRYFPKGESLQSYSQKDCDRAADAINNTPRKILNYSTAKELFDKELEILSNPKK